MTTVTILDSHRWTMQLNGRRIPRDSFIPIQEAEALISQANAILQQAKEEAGAIREQAYKEGFAAGQAEAVTKMAEYLAESQRHARDHLNDAEQRLINLAGAIVKRILPSLPYDAVLADLATAALRATRAERYLRVRVHPSAVETVRARLDEWRHIYFAVDSLEVGGDPSLGIYGCVVESEMGTVHAGLDDQIEILLNAAQEVASHA